MNLSGFNIQIERLPFSGSLFICFEVLIGVITNPGVL